MPITSTVRATRGEDFTLVVTVEGTGDITSWNPDLLFTLAPKAGKPFVIQKAGFVVDGPGRQVGAYLTATETASIKAKTWEWDYWKMISGAKSQLARGPFALDESVRPVPLP